MVLLIGGVVLAGMSILLFAMMSMAKSEERLAREAERELESISSGAVYGKPRANAGMVEPKQPVRDQSGSGKSSSGKRVQNYEPSEEEAFV